MYVSQAYEATDRLHTSSFQTPEDLSTHSDLYFTYPYKASLSSSKDHLPDPLSFTVLNRGESCHRHWSSLSSLALTVPVSKLWSWSVGLCFHMTHLTDPAQKCLHLRCSWVSFSCNVNAGERLVCTKAVTPATEWRIGSHLLWSLWSLLSGQVWNSSWLSCLTISALTSARTAVPSQSVFLCFHKYLIVGWLLVWNK